MGLRRASLGLALALCLATTADEPRGAIAIYRDSIPAPAASASPEHLAEWLEGAGFETAFLTSEDLADTARLDRARFDVVVLPYGPVFPVSAADTFRRFLRAGGKLFTTGGYAFDHLIERGSEGWRAYQPPPPPRQQGVAWFCDLPAAGLRGRGALTFRGLLRSANVAGPGFAHFSVYQFAADASLLAWRDLCQVRGTHDWEEHVYTFDVHPQAATVSLRAGLYQCRGAAWFDAVRLDDAAGSPLLESQFEEAPHPDRRDPPNWWRSDAERCAWRADQGRGGSGALEATLGFELPRIERLNTRHGHPADGLDVEPTQLGLFQADYPLARAVSVRAARGQPILPPDLAVSAPIEGWAACGVVGWDTARWTPLLNAHDSYGRLRGAAGALLRHYGGQWRGSSWAFFGVTNLNLFAPAQPGMSNAFLRIVKSLVDDAYIASLTTDADCYRQGEEVGFNALVFNGGRAARTLHVAVAICAGEPAEPAASGESLPVSASDLEGAEGEPVATLRFDVAVGPGQTNLVSGRWRPARFESDFYRLVAHLADATNVLDQIAGGFVVRDEKTIASGPRLTCRDNYLRFGDRPLFQFGTDDWSYVFTTARETPLQWLEDMRLRRDLGVTLYENLQFGLPRSATHEDQLLRKVDGVVQLAQEYGQVYFAGLLVGYNAAASDADLELQRDYCARFARRYASVPGLIHYLNGDYRCEPGDAVTPQWNDFLRERYGGDDALRQAWGKHAPAQPLGAIPSVNSWDWDRTWDDVSAYDENCFRAWLIRRWNRELIAGIRQHDTNHPTSGEFYQLPHGGVDLPAGIDGLDLANFGFFDKPGLDLARFPALCKLNDQRTRGKSGGPGEYGVKTHPAWGDGRDYGYHTARTPEEAIDLFLAIPHTALGLGASRIHNWCWKDDAHRVFPWGMIYPCDGVPKDTAYVHRNLSLLFRHFAPVYREPEVYVLTPDCHRMGGGKWRVTDGILASMDVALEAHVHNLGTLNEEDGRIPASARVLFYPIPYCLSDATYGVLLRWVEQGGVLYLSGDFCYDARRQRSRPDRLTELAGVRRLSANDPPLGVDPGKAADCPELEVEPVTATVLRRAPGGAVLLVENRVGRGRVFYTPDPIELHSTPDRRPTDVALYRRVIEAGGVSPLGIEPDSPSLHVYSVPLRDGGQVRLVANRDETRPLRTVTLTDTPSRSTLDIAPRRFGLLWHDGQNALRAVEVQGKCRIADEWALTDETGGAVLSLDGQAIPGSKALLLMPLRAGDISWSSKAQWSQPRIETGEFQNGGWRAFENEPALARQDQVAVRISARQALSLLLVCEQDALPHWRRALETALTNPGSLP